MEMPMLNCTLINGCPTANQLFQLSLWSQPYWQAHSITQYNCMGLASATGFATPKANAVE